ncbi:MAG: hypothetical protein IT195_01955 [Microthrixaceae bacterium]|nr:hypothetical protein [Microthrixaceae bacterium]
MSPSPRPGRLKGWFRRTGAMTSRFGLLAAIIALCGVALGVAVGYPISQLDISTDEAVVLDQNSIRSFDLEAALLGAEDLPDGWSLSEKDLSTFTMIGQPICGQTPVIDNQMGQKLARTYENTRDGALLLTEAIRVRRVADSVGYVNEMGKTFEGCKRGFYRQNQDGTSTKVELRAGQPDPPISDYQSRMLQPPKGEHTQLLVFMAVGDVIVSLQYVGPSVPPRELLSDAQRKLLVRLTPDQFGTKRTVPGEQTLPSEPTTTSTTTTTLPPTTLPPTTTTRPKKRSSSATTKAPATAPPATAAPATGATGGPGQ